MSKLSADMYLQILMNICISFLESEKEKKHTFIYNSKFYVVYLGYHGGEPALEIENLPQEHFVFFLEDLAIFCLESIFSRTHSNMLTMGFGSDIYDIRLTEDKQDFDITKKRKSTKSKKEVDSDDEEGSE